MQIDNNIIKNNIEKVMATKGYTFFKGVYDLNVIWIRSEDSHSNKFDDLCYISYINNLGDWEDIFYPATTNPGKNYLLNPLNIKGTAILCPTQVRSAHKIGRHSNYTALRQQKPIPYVRDNTRDSINNYDLYRDCLGNTCVTQDNKKIIWDDIIYANIHRASKWVTSKYVGVWSAGCMVIANPTHFNNLMKLVNTQKDVVGTDSVTFTLLEERDFFNF